MREYEVYWFLLLMAIILVCIPLLCGMLIAYIVNATGFGYYILVCLVTVIMWLMISVLWWI